MAEAPSPATGLRYGVARVCRVWDVPRSSFYAARQVGVDDTKSTTSSARRGPKPAVSDADLLVAIRADLARSPWTDEGHRKVWAELALKVPPAAGRWKGRRRADCARWTASESRASGCCG
jgi:putative transposase